MSEFKVNRERQKVYLEERRPADGSYHAGDFQTYAEAFASRHPVSPDEVGIRLVGKCDCGLVMRLWAHRDETDDEMNARIEKEEYDAERGMKDARAREQQRRADDLHILKLITERLGKDTVLKTLEGMQES
jgi:hypothetical protein